MAYNINVSEAFEKYGKSVFSAAYSLCRNSHDANDIMQDVFFKLHCIKKSFNDAEHMKRWLIRCSVNAAKNLLRTQKRKEILTEDTAQNDISFENERQSCLADAVKGLTEKQRIAIHLFYYEDYSAKEIAAVTGQSETGVRMCLQRAKEKLKSILGEEFYYD